MGDRPVATIPSRQDVDQGHSRGFYEPSNIVKRGDAYYALIRAGAEGAQKVGTCLFRTDDLTRPNPGASSTARDFPRTWTLIGTMSATRNHARE